MGRCHSAERACNPELPFPLTLGDAGIPVAVPPASSRDPGRKAHLQGHGVHLFARILICSGNVRQLPGALMAPAVAAQQRDSPTRPEEKDETDGCPDLLRGYSSWPLGLRLPRPDVQKYPAQQKKAKGSSSRLYKGAPRLRRFCAKSPRSYATIRRSRPKPLHHMCKFQTSPTVKDHD